MRALGLAHETDDQELQSRIDHLRRASGIAERELAAALATYQLAYATADRAKKAFALAIRMKADRARYAMRLPA